jgi:hypothetical protein
LNEFQTQRLPVTPCDSPKKGRSEPGSEELQSHQPLYYFDQVFTILGKISPEMADKISFDLRRIKKNCFFPV